MRSQYKKRTQNRFRKESWGIDPSFPLIDGIDHREDPTAKIWELLRRTPIYRSLYRESFKKEEPRSIPFNPENPSVLSNGRWKVPDTELELKRARRDVALGPLYSLIASSCHWRNSWLLLSARQRNEVQPELIWPKLKQPSEVVSLGFCEVARKKCLREVITKSSHPFIHLPKCDILEKSIGVKRFIVLRLYPFESEPEIVRQVLEKCTFLNDECRREEHAKLDLSHSQERKGAKARPNDGLCERFLHWRPIEANADHAGLGPFPSTCGTVLCYFPVNAASTAIALKVRSIIKNRKRWFTSFGSGEWLDSAEIAQNLCGVRRNPISMPDFWWGMASFDAKKRDALRKDHPVGDYLFQSKNVDCSWFHQKALQFEQIILSIDRYWMERRIDKCL